jgi:hypothetical protein
MQELKKAKIGDPNVPVLDDVSQLKEAATKARAAVDLANKVNQEIQKKKVQREEKKVKVRHGGWYCECGEPKSKCDIGPFNWKEW